MATKAGERGQRGVGVAREPDELRVAAAQARAPLELAWHWSRWLGVRAICLALEPLAWHWSHQFGIGAIAPRE